MQIGDTVFHVNGTRPMVHKVRLDALTENWFSAYERVGGFDSWWQGWGQIFDNPVEADRAIIRNIDRAIADHQKQIDSLLINRADVMARLET